MKINVNSEIGELEGVIIHTPGNEVENMTPKNAERALYSDILNLSVINKEYSQFKKVLQKVTKVYEVSDLLKKVVSQKNSKKNLIEKICITQNTNHLLDYLMDLTPQQLTKQLIEGVPLIKNSFSNYLNKNRFELQPLHNFFFTRDASMTVNDKVLIAKLANKVRSREAIIMEAIFNQKSIFETTTVNAESHLQNGKITFEGGDVLVARKDVILIGLGARTTPEGVDFLIDHFNKDKTKKDLIIQLLPKEPESFIHLDMIFTFLDNDKCLIYPPVVLDQPAFQTIHIRLDNGKVKFIREEKNILTALSKLRIKVEPIACGGNNDEWIQEREQWHSGANFFAIAPGKIIGYGRNEHTINEINKCGFEVIKAKDVINNKVKLHNYKKFVVTIEGAELARGGGGARCMTMPINRKDIS